jgi:hypothetical protein
MIISQLLPESSAMQRCIESQKHLPYFASDTSGCWAFFLHALLQLRVDRHEMPKTPLSLPIGANSTQSSHGSNSKALLRLRASKVKRAQGSPSLVATGTFSHHAATAAHASHLRGLRVTDTDTNKKRKRDVCGSGEGALLLAKALRRVHISRVNRLIGQRQEGS